MKCRRKFGKDFKRKVAEEVRSGLLTATQAMKQYDLSSNLVYRWIDRYDHGKLDNEPTDRGAFENKIAELERKVGQQAMEIELLKKLQVSYREKLNAKPSGCIPGAVFPGGAK